MQIHAESRGMQCSCESWYMEKMLGTGHFHVGTFTEQMWIVGL